MDCTVRGSIPAGQEISVFSKMPSPAIWPMYPAIQWVLGTVPRGKVPGARGWPLTFIYREVKSEWSCTSTTSIHVCLLGEHGDNFTFCHSLGPFLEVWPLICLIIWTCIFGNVVLVCLIVSLHCYIHMFGCGEHHIEYCNGTVTNILFVVSSVYIFAIACLFWYFIRPGIN